MIALNLFVTKKNLLEMCRVKISMNINIVDIIGKTAVENQIQLSNRNFIFPIDNKKKL